MTAPSSRRYRRATPQSYCPSSWHVYRTTQSSGVSLRTSGGKIAGRARISRWSPSNARDASSPMLSFLVAAYMLQAVQQSAPPDSFRVFEAPSDSAGLTSAVRHRPDDAREALRRLLARTATSLPESVRSEQLESAMRLARAYASVWRDLVSDVSGRRVHAVAPGTAGSEGHRRQPPAALELPPVANLASPRRSDSGAPACARPVRWTIRPEWPQR